MGARIGVSVIDRDSGDPIMIEATSSDETVLAVEDSGFGGLVVVAVGPGTARISIPGDSLLLRVAEVERAVLASAPLPASRLFLAGWWSAGCAASDVALLEGSSPALEIALFAGSERLAGAATITGADELGRLAVGGAGTQRVDVVLPDGSPLEIEAVVVAAIDRIEPDRGIAARLARPRIEVSTFTALCFRGVAGGQHVAGAALEFEGSEGLEVESFGDACASLVSEVPGEHTLTVTSGDVALSEVIDVVEPEVVEP